MGPTAIGAAGGRPRQFRQPRVLIVGCGDVGLRVVQAVRGRLRLRALTSDPGRIAGLRAAGVQPLLGNLDDPASLTRLAGLAHRVLHLAPPPGRGREDPRTAALLRALAQRGGVRRLVYGSTTGVYGDCGGMHIDETRALRPGTDRAHRRVDAERQVRAFGRALGTAVAILRIPGIYALDRPGGDPRERLRRGTPVLQAQQDVYTNHVHADDLARACIAALWRGGPQRVFHVCDDAQRRVGEHYDLVADLTGLPRPPRIDRETARATLGPAVLSFWGESRRLSNRRMKRELKLRLRYPSVREALEGLAATMPGAARPGPRELPTIRP